MILKKLKAALVAGAKRVRLDINLRDVFAFGGLGMVGHGIAMVSPSAAWIVVGVAVFWLGVRR